MEINKDFATLAREIAAKADSPAELRGEIVRRMTPKFISEFADKNNLVAHKGNHFPLIIALAYKNVLLKEGGAVYLYGPTGAGVTTLLDVIHRNAEYSDDEIYYKQGFELYEELIDAIRNGTTRVFRIAAKKLVLIDDIDVFINGKPTASEEIARIIYRVVINSGHVFLTGRTSLDEVPDSQYLESIVTSYGYQVPISLPVVEDRIRYVFSRCRSEKERRYIEDLLDNLAFTALSFNELNLLLLKAALSEGRGA